MADPESGLGTAEYLTQRLAEVYGAAARQGITVTSTHALVMIDVSVVGLGPVAADGAQRGRGPGAQGRVRRRSPHGAPW